MNLINKLFYLRNPFWIRSIVNEDLQTSSLDKTVENSDFDRGVLVLINLLCKALRNFSFSDSKQTRLVAAIRRWYEEVTLILLHFFCGHSKSSHNLRGIDDRRISSV